MRFFLLALRKLRESSTYVQYTSRPYSPIVIHASDDVTQFRKSSTLLKILDVRERSSLQENVSANALYDVPRRTAKSKANNKDVVKVKVG